MTTQAAAIKAARTYRETQPAIDALKDVMAANTAAKKTLGEYMLAADLALFRGVELRVVAFSGWDMTKLSAYLGDKAAQFRAPKDRRYFGLAKRAKAKA